MKADEATRSELVESLEEFCRRYGVGDADGAMALMTRDPDVLLVEPGPYQFWVGQDEVRRNLQLDFEAVEGDIPVRVFPRHASVDGDVGWLLGDLELAIRYKGRSILLQDLRFTAIAKRADGAWRWSGIHATITDFDQRADEVWKDKALHERLGLTDAESHGALARRGRKPSGSLFAGKAPSVDAVASLEELLRRYGAGETEGAMALTTDDDDVVLVEPGPHQFWVGRDDVRRNLQLDYDAVAGDIAHKTYVHYASSHGNVAWLIGDLELAMNYNGRRVDMRDLRFTAIARRVDGDWRWACLAFGHLDPEKGPGDQWLTWTIHERLTGVPAGES